MKKSGLSLIVLLLSVTNISFSQDLDIKKGVLRINLLKFDYTNKLELYNQDGSIFTTVFKDPKDDDYKVKNASGKFDNDLLNNIRAFYLDYGVMIFDTDSSMGSGSIGVFVGREKKLLDIKEIKGLISYQSWPSFLKTIFLKIIGSAYVYYDTTGTRKRILKAENYSYSVKKVIGEWVYVECAKTCEECPQNKIIRGWVKWRNGMKLLVNLYYFC
jgi:hypothetical protein